MIKFDEVQVGDLIILEKDSEDYTIGSKGVITDKDPVINAVEVSWDANFVSWILNFMFGRVSPVDPMPGNYVRINKDFDHRTGIFERSYYDDLVMVKFEGKDFLEPFPKENLRVISRKQYLNSLNQPFLNKTSAKNPSEYREENEMQYNFTKGEQVQVKGFGTGIFLWKEFSRGKVVAIVGFSHSSRKETFPIELLEPVEQSSHDVSENEDILSSNNTPTQKDTMFKYEDILFIISEEEKPIRSICRLSPHQYKIAKAIVSMICTDGFSKKIPGYKEKIQAIKTLRQLLHDTGQQIMLRETNLLVDHLIEQEAKK
jgi:hypothetical protein